MFFFTKNLFETHSVHFIFVVCNFWLSRWVDLVFIFFIPLHQHFPIQFLAQLSVWQRILFGLRFEICVFGFLYFQYQLWMEELFFFHIFEYIFYFFFPLRMVLYGNFSRLVFNLTLRFPLHPLYDDTVIFFIRYYHSDILKHLLCNK